MSKVCAVCGKKPGFGHNRSHSMVATKRRFNPNLQQDTHTLEVRVEAALRGHHRVTPVVAEARLLPANGANLGHRPGSVAAAKRPWLSGTRLRAAARRRLPSR